MAQLLAYVPSGIFTIWCIRCSENRGISIRIIVDQRKRRHDLISRKMWSTGSASASRFTSFTIWSSDLFTLHSKDMIVLDCFIFVPRVCHLNSGFVSYKILIFLGINWICIYIYINVYVYICLLAQWHATCLLNSSWWITSCFKVHLIESLEFSSSIHADVSAVTCPSQFFYTSIGKWYSASRFDNRMIVTISFEAPSIYAYAITIRH